MKTFHLSTDSLHFKLMKWVWEIDETDFSNMCPYFWATLGTILVLPLILLIKYSVLTYQKYEVWKFRRQMKSLNKPPRKRLIDTWLGQWWSRAGENIILAVAAMAIFAIILILLFGAIKTAGPLWGMLLFIGVILGSIAVAWGINKVDENGTEWMRWLVNSWFGQVIIFLFLLVWNLFLLIVKPIIYGIKWIATKVGILYKNACPPIDWNS